MVKKARNAFGLAAAAAMILLCSASLAQEEAAPVPPSDAPAPPPAASTGTSDADTTEGEGATAQAMARDPFWPVGFVPPKPKAADEPVVADEPEPERPLQWEDALKTLSVQGIMKTGSAGEYVAVINGQVVSAGETVSARYQEREYSWLIRKISNKGVSFERLTASR